MKFEVYQSEKSKKFYFRLKAANGQVVLTSQGYASKASAMNGVESVQKHAKDDANFERKESTSGQPYFNLKASNGQVIGNSEMYSSKSAMENGVKAVGRAADGAKVADLTQE
jgi:uncharacterized protein YegP (UPF0339 family)